MWKKLKPHDLLRLPHSDYFWQKSCSSFATQIRKHPSSRDHDDVLQYNINLMNTVCLEQRYNSSETGGGTFHRQVSLGCKVYSVSYTVPIWIEASCSSEGC